MAIHEYEATEREKAFLEYMRGRMCRDGKPSEPDATDAYYTPGHVASYMAADFEMQNQQTGTLVYSAVEFSGEFGYIERVFAGNLTRRHGYRWQEIAALCEDGMCVSRNCFWTSNSYGPNFHVYGFDGKRYRSRSWYMSDREYDSEYHLSDIESRMIPRMCVTPPEEMMAMDERARYCAYDADSNIHFIDYIALYRRHPVGEMLMKMKLFRMVNEKAMAKIGGDRQFQKWLCRNAEECRYLCYTTAHNSYRKNPSADPREYADAVNRRRQCARELSHACEFAVPHAKHRELYKKIMSRTTPERLCDYISHTKYCNPHTYFDYANAADWLELDFSDTKVLFPRNFQEVHDDYTEQYGRWRDEQNAIAEAKRKKDAEKERRLCAAGMARTADKFAFVAFQRDGYTALVARTKRDLIHEGSLQKNCVGRMDYDRKMADGKSVICFVRRTDDIGTPFITAEIATDNMRIVQFYGAENSPVPEMDGWRGQWQEFIRKKARRIEKCPS